MINFREISFHVSPNAHMMISCNNHNFPPFFIDVFHTVFESLSFHGLARIYLTDLNNLEVNNLIFNHYLAQKELK